MNKVAKKVVLTAVVLGMVTPLFAQNKGFKQGKSVAVQGSDKAKADDRKSEQIYEGIKREFRLYEELRASARQYKALLDSDTATDKEKQEALLKFVDSYMAVPERAQWQFVPAFKEFNVNWKDQKNTLPQAKRNKYERFLQVKSKAEAKYNYEMNKNGESISIGVFPH